MFVSSRKAPLMSVLITCYSRKEFILRAIESVLNQTIDRSTYEIIVSKNYKDVYIDDFLIKNHCKIIFDERSGIGVRLAGLIRAAESDILVFLEDDDCFKGNKLEEIFNIFKDPEVNYVNNAYLTVDYNGNHLSTDHNPALGNAWGVSTPVSNFRIMRKLFKKKLYFSMSNISVRRFMVSEYIDDLSKIRVAPDFFMFVTALQNKGIVMYCPTTLTVWRLHSSTSVASGPRDEFLKKRKDFWSSVRSDLELLSLVSESSTSKKLIYCVYSEAMTHNMVLGESQFNRIDVIIRVAKSFALLRNAHFFNLLILALVGSISPVKTSFIYSKYLLSKAPKI